MAKRIMDGQAYAVVFKRQRETPDGPLTSDDQMFVFANSLGEVDEYVRQVEAPNSVVIVAVQLQVTKLHDARENNVPGLN